MSTTLLDQFVLILGNEEDHKDHEALAVSLKEYGVETVRANPKEITSIFQEKENRFFIGQQEIKPALVLGWVFEDILRMGMNLLYAFERSGIPVINTAETLFCGQNKYLNSEALHREGIPHFPVISGFSETDVGHWTDELSFPLVHKQIVSAGGQAVIKVDSPGLLKDLARTFAQYNEHYYAQPYTEKPDRDIRVICIDFQTTSAFYKYTPEGEWVTNVVRGGKPVLIHNIDPELAQMAERAAKAMGARIAGIDILEDPSEGYKVLEVNTCPNFNLRQFMPEATAVNEKAIAKMMIKEMKKTEHVI
ncbi:RimK family alpha-L-glutamate ligase [Bacillus sp. CLL-7-23]|uniref:RimK family alpha-L-glutamate ligase n=1 Tax=Bacillus changyiensis TaxID=3004103 RepID=A0ABT4X521_9BACI|nr:RimK family alpha-L-glutamate ligase [Bacillus changyiensis]MDA7027394.1 RimK family alpha-L-glutamate ligase [Bacillus changyiensis]